MSQQVLLDLGSIEPSKKQSRTVFDPDRLLELANSIREQGVLQPILVRQTGPKKYEIIAGERRFRACKLIGLSKIPAIIKSSDETASMIGSFLENAQREDLSSAEKENALISLWRTGGFNTPKDLDKALGYTSGYSGSIIEAREFREKYNIPSTLTTTSIISTKGLPEDVRHRLLLRVTKDEGKFGQVRTIRELKAIIDKAPPQIVERIVDGKIDVDEARRVVELYQQIFQNESLKPLASALAIGEVSSGIAEKTIKLYNRLAQGGAKLNPEIIARDLEEIKRQSALDVVHEKLIEQARVEVLTGRKSAIEFKIADPGEGFVREVSDIAWRIQRWGIPNLMESGAERWKIAIKYFREIDSKMHSLLGYTKLEQNSSR